MHNVLRTFNTLSNQLSDTQKYFSDCFYEMKLSELARREIPTSMNQNLISKLELNQDGVFNDFNHFNQCCVGFVRECNKTIRFLNSNDIALLPELQDNVKEHKNILKQAAGILLFYRTLNNFDYENGFDVEVMVMDMRWKLRDAVSGLQKHPQGNLCNQ